MISTSAKGVALGMRFSKSGILSKVIILVLIVFSFSRLISTQRSIANARENLEELQRQVVEQELINAELEYAIENYNDPDVIANIARTQLGLVLPGEIVFHNMDIE